MLTTSFTLLEALHVPGNPAAWERFVQLYAPFLYRWARRTGLPEPDVEDLVQDVFELLLRKLPQFRYQPGGSFRGWLRVVALNKLRERGRTGGKIPVATGASLDQVPAPDEDDAFAEAEYQRLLVHRALQIIQPEFSEATWNAFQAHVVAGREAVAVAGDLGLRVGTVYAAKSRVLTRLRQELHGLLD